jgi:DNA-binding transcriptional ArsR family regulator
VDAAAIVGLLAEPERLRVLAALVLGARTPVEIGGATGLDARAVGRALQKLQAGGLVDESGVRIELFKEAARAAAPAPEGTGDVLARFVRDGRLVTLPAQALRRYLVDHQLLSREGGEYRRSGGWVDVLTDTGHLESG